MWPRGFQKSKDVLKSCTTVHGKVREEFVSFMKEALHFVHTYLMKGRES